MKFLKSKAGFSLIELMIVVAIIGILAAVAIPNFMRFQSKSRQAEARTALSAVYTAQKAFNQEWQTYFGDLPETGYFPEGIFRFSHGFGGAGAGVTPDNYTGAIGVMAAPTQLSTNSIGCAINAGAGTAVTKFMGTQMWVCGVIDDQANNAAAVADQNMFIAHAVGNIDDDATMDHWSVNESKVFTGPGSAYNAMDGGDLDL